MSDLVEAEGHASHHLPPEVVGRQQRRAVQLFILADMVFFACLLFTYFYLRALDVDGGWIPDGGATTAPWKSWLIALVTIAAAASFRSGVQGLQAGVRSTFDARALAGLVLVVFAVALVIYQIVTWPILMSDGSYASTFIVMTWVQLVHLVVLLFLAFGVWNRGVKGKLDSNASHAVVVGYFWNWVALTSLLGALTTFFV